MTWSQDPMQEPPQQWGPHPGQPGPREPQGSPEPPQRGSGRGWWQVPTAAVLAAALATAGTWTLAEQGVIGQDEPAQGVSREPAEGAPASASAQQSDDSTNQPAEAEVAAGSTPASDPHWSGIAEKVSPSVVAVTLANGAGSGVVLDDEGHIVTNHHVVAEGGPIHVTLQDGRSYPAEVVGSDPVTDLAVLELEDGPKDLQPITVGDDKDLKVGDPVMAIGNPLGYAGTVTTGIVSALDRPVRASGKSAEEPVVTNAVQTSAPINPGNSGGALVDSRGRLVGINSSIASMGRSADTAGSIGIGFAITATQMKNVTKDLIESGSARHPQIGVRIEDGRVEHDGAQLAAAGVVSVEEGSAAAKAGLQKGDAIVGLDDNQIDGVWSLIAQVREQRVGDEVILRVIREGKEREVPLTVASGAKGEAPAEGGTP